MCRNQMKEAEMESVPQIKGDEIEEKSPVATQQVKNIPKLVEPDAISCKSDSHQPMKKSLSSWDINHAFNRLLPSKSKQSSSSTSELTLTMDSRDQELEKRKWYHKLRLSSSKSSLDGTSEKSEKKKKKMFQSSKRLATAL